LYDLKGRPASRGGSTRVTINKDGIEVITDDKSSDNYRYNSNEPINKLDSIKQKLENEKQRMKDSLEKVKERIEQQLDKIGNANIEPAPVSAKLVVYNPMMNIN
jgi:hypothetical protein